MSVLGQICVIFAVCLTSEALAAVLPLPSGVLSMVLLLLLLAVRAVKPRQLQESSSFMLGHMPLFFVPACVGLLEHLELLLDNLWPIVLISVLTTPVVFLVTGHVVQLTMKLLKKKGEKTV